MAPGDRVFVACGAARRSEFARSRRARLAGSGVLPELIELAGSPEHVVTIADFGGAREHGVRFSSGNAGRALRALAQIGELVESGRFSLPVADLPARARRGGAPGRRGRPRAASSSW